ncbi:MAG: tRNA lysidine(34) synthetase TilS [Treponema sp.]|nr:tRNA lysidine(34) synthetase TilS [Treponema sp.]
MNSPVFEQLFEDGLGSWCENSAFVAAVSGGADSTAMLIALSALAKKRNYHVSCLHIKHNIRSQKESDDDVHFVRSLCHRLQIPCRIVSIKPGKIAERASEKGVGIEAAAREYRQAAYRHELKRLGAAKIIVAHNQNDVLENSLMRMLRGSGPRGLASMPPSTHLILRPMLHISRTQILAYLETMHQSFQTDISNHDTIYLRNRVRNVLIPLLNEHFSHWEKGIESLGDTQAFVADYLEAEARRLVSWQICECGLETSEEIFHSLNPVIQEEAVFQGIEKLLKCSSGKNDTLRADYQRQYKVPRRSVLRCFFKNNDESLDLGKIRLERSGGILRILLWEDPLALKGEVFCAEKSGVYQCMNYLIQIGITADTQFNEKNMKMVSDTQIFCELPVIFRSPLPGEKNPSAKLQNKKTKSAKNSIIVEDRNGKIAFLWLDKNNVNIFLYEDRKSIGNIAISVGLM